MAQNISGATRVAIQKMQGGRVIEIAVSGQLQTEDYDRLLPAVEEAIQEHGKVRLMVITRDFKGWTAGALWEDVRFDAKHYDDVERLALLGDSISDEAMAMICKPFTKAQVRYFQRDDLDEARQWVQA